MKRTAVIIDWEAEGVVAKNNFSREECFFMFIASDRKSAVSPSKATV